MKNSWMILIGSFLTSCVSDGFLGATVGDCDEYCTVYNTPKNLLMEKYDVSDKNFPDKKERKHHISKLNETYEVNSWFYTIDEQEDTIYIDFSCSVQFDSKQTKYVVSNLKDEHR